MSTQPALIASYSASSNPSSSDSTSVPYTTYVSELRKAVDAVRAELNEVLTKEMQAVPNETDAADDFEEVETEDEDEG
ncbi:hypothetical protein HDU85_005746 [Gaertneriomyces sp. JEL0708]|nr:hypothetical protein HDU85_005746 [Gaertneriomyces sp. JEL0708]